MSRFAIRDEILRLDPEKDHFRIAFLSGAYEFPWLTTRALEFALFRTYAVPSISKLLDETGQFVRAGQRRYDDTSLILAEISEHGYDSERGRAALRRMNRLHGRFDIGNDDYLYVLSTFVFEPARWIDRFGWRRTTEHEKLAAYYFWREVGRRMNIRDIPATRAAYEQFNIAYEREHFRCTGSNYRVGEATIRIFLGWYPQPLHPVIREATYALLDDPLREAFGFPKASNGLRMTVEGALRLRGRFIRYLMPPRRRPRLLTQEGNRSYPFGYEIERLGPVDVPPDRPVGSRREVSAHAPGDSAPVD
ncbi:MAG: oxygenase MpaB family protein [Chloroflexota bacterium]